MKFTIILLSLFSYSFAPADDFEIIYGEDSRQEVEQTSYSDIALFTVAMVNKEQFSNPKSLGDKRNLCSGERFEKQPSLSSCSGLLVKGRYVVTAAHCLGYSSIKTACQENGWQLDYRTHNGQAQIDKSKLLNCRRVIEIDRQRDYAVIELTRSVRKRYFSPRLQNGLKDEPYITFGFPAGLPMKKAAGELIKQDGVQKLPLFNFDTFSGSSGSPIFNQSRELVGLIKFGKTDYYLDQDRNCYRANKCDSYGMSCQVDDASELEGEVALLFSEIPKHRKLARILR